MNQHYQRAAEGLAKILEVDSDSSIMLGYTHEQFDLVGRMTALSSEPIVNYVKVQYSNRYWANGKACFESNPRETPTISVGVALQKELETATHEYIQAKILEMLRRNKIRSSTLFSYCNKSFGIEAPDVSVHFGFSYPHEAQDEIYRGRIVVRKE